MTGMLAVLIRGGLVTVGRIAQDGTRVTLTANNSFKQPNTIEQALQQAQAHLEIIKRQAERAEDATERRTAEERTAHGEDRPLKQATGELAKVEQRKPAEGQAHENARATTVPEARFMRMPDGGTRPALNVQLAVDTRSRLIVGVDVTNAGSDAGLAEPMREQTEERTDEDREGIW